jgi:hypothetical protein
VSLLVEVYLQPFFIFRTRQRWVLSSTPVLIYLLGKELSVPIRQEIVLAPEMV